MIRSEKYLHIYAASVLCLALFICMSPRTVSQTTTTTTTVSQTTTTSVPTTITKANITITASTTSTITVSVAIVTITQANITVTTPTTATVTLSTFTLPTYSYVTVFTPVTFTAYIMESTTVTSTRTSTETITSSYSITLMTTKPFTVTTTLVSTTTTSVLTKTVLVPSYGKCVIASATYGSSLAPEVQLLRMFRDQFLEKTFAGSTFMKAFNAFYYSFSPTVAELISRHPAARVLMQGVLYPLVGILDLSSQTYFLFGSGTELAAVAVGLSAALLIGVAYFSPFMMLLSCGVGRRRILS